MPAYPSIAVFCGSSDTIPAAYTQPAFELGGLLARRGIRLVFGAGKTGLMGAAADGVLQAGGEAVGVVNESLNLPHLIHAGLTRLEVVADMNIRKARMLELAQAVIALPGGFGTWDELFEVLALVQIGQAAHPVGLLNTRGYYDPLLEQIALARQEGFVYAEHTGLIVAHSEPEGLLRALEAYQPPAGLERWVTREEKRASLDA